MVLQPENDTPVDGATGTLVYPTLVSKGYFSLYGSVQQDSQWQVATDSGFNTIVVDENGGVVESYDVTTGLSTLTEHF